MVFFREGRVDPVACSDAEWGLQGAEIKLSSTAQIAEARTDCES
jgi:hypothetical protein